MKKINLRDYYPFYTTDTIVEVPDEVADLLHEYKLNEAAYILRTYRHKAYFSLDYLADLHDPDALQLLSCGLVPGVGQTEGVAKPFPAQLPEQGALADAGLAIQDQDRVELAARLQHALDGSDQGLPGDGADVGGVLGAQIVDQQRVHSRHAVPLGQVLDVLPQRVEAALVRDDGQRLGEAILRELDAVLVGHISIEEGVVSVAPVFARAAPGQLALDLDGAAQLIVPDPLKGGVVLQDQHGVGDQRLDVAVLGADELGLPAVIDVVRDRHALKFEHRSPLCIARERQADAGIFAGPFSHGLVTWELVDRFVLVAVIQVPELVDADQVEGVAELAAGRVGAVVGVGEDVAVIDHEAGSS